MAHQRYADDTDFDAIIKLFVGSKPPAACIVFSFTEYMTRHLSLAPTVK